MTRPLPSARHELRASDASEAPSTRQHLIDVAGALFYQQGIRAVGVDEVVRVANVAKTTLYRHFSGKNDLVLAYLEQRSELARAKLLETGAEAPDAKARIIATFQALEAYLANPGFRGCAFLLAVSEHGENEAIREVSHAYKLFVRDHFATLASEAGLPEETGERLAVVYEGALATAVVRPESASARVAVDIAKILLSEGGRG